MYLIHVYAVLIRLALTEYTGPPSLTVNISPVRHGCIVADSLTSVLSHGALLRGGLPVRVVNALALATPRMAAFP